MSRRQIGQESFGFSECDRQHSCLDDLARLIDWAGEGVTASGRQCLTKRNDLPITFLNDALHTSKL